VAYIGLFVFMVLVYYVFTGIKDKRYEKHFYLSLGFKLSAGLGVGLLYWYHYRNGDTLQFDEAAHLILGSVRTIKGWFLFLFHSDLSFLGSSGPPLLEEPRSLFFVKILSLIYLITGGSYWLASLYLSLFSFLGAWKLSETISRHWPQLKYPAIIAFLYFPPVVFWSSGVLKDSVAYGCITLLSSLVIRGMRKETLGANGILAGVLLIWILWSLKYHLAAVLLLAVGMGSVYQPIKSRFKGTIGDVLLLLIFIAFVIALSFLHSNFLPGNLAEVLRQNHQKIIAISESGNLIHFFPYGTGLTHFFLNLPLSLFAGLYMPLPWQGTGFLALMAGIFNILILLFTMIKIYFWKWKTIRFNAWILMLGIYVGVLAILMAYTTPNFGTLERYKSAYIPFYILWILNNEKWLQVIKSLFLHKS
jgi:hypothetical protein